MAEPHPRRQRLNSLDVVFAALLNIVDDLDHPVIVDVSDGRVAVT
jgi:hypothetical protein